MQIGFQYIVPAFHLEMRYEPPVCYFSKPNAELQIYVLEIPTFCVESRMHGVCMGNSSAQESKLPARSEVLNKIFN